MIEIPEGSHYSVYKLTAPNGLIYIGCTGQKVEIRWRKGYGKKYPIRAAIDEFGFDAFKKEVLCENLTREGGSKIEKWFIAWYDSTNPEKGYNRMLGGLDKGQELCEASKQLDRESVKKVYDSDPTYRVRVGDGVSKAFANNPEILEAISACSRKFWEDPLAHEKKSRQMKEYLSRPENRAFFESSHCPVPVRCVETGEVYCSQKEAERMTGFKSIHLVCQGRRRTAGGYHWEKCNK